MVRPISEIRDDIDRCNWLREHLPNLGDVLLQDRALTRLKSELATAEQEAA